MQCGPRIPVTARGVSIGLRSEIRIGGSKASPTRQPSTNGESAEIANARRDRRQLEIELDRVIAAIRAGMDPVLATGQTRQIQAVITRPQRASISGNDHAVGPPNSPKTTCENPRAANGLVGLLAKTARPDRAELYQALG